MIVLKLKRIASIIKLQLVVLSNVKYAATHRSRANLLRYFKNWEDVLVNNLTEIDKIKTKSEFLNVINALKHTSTDKFFASNVKCEAAILLK